MDQPSMTATDLLRHVFPWEERAGVPRTEPLAVDPDDAEPGG